MAWADASTRQLQWAVDARTLTFAALVLAAGSFSVRYGGKDALLAALAVFSPLGHWWARRQPGHVGDVVNRQSCPHPINHRSEPAVPQGGER